MAEKNKTGNVATPHTPLSLNIPASVSSEESANGHNVKVSSPGELIREAESAILALSSAWVAANESLIKSTSERHRTFLINQKEATDRAITVLKRLERHCEILSRHNQSQPGIVKSAKDLTLCIKEMGLRDLPEAQESNKEG